MSSAERHPTQAEKLEKLLKDNGLNPTRLGRLMAEQGGPSAGSRRAQISKWLRPRIDLPGEHGTISDENARAIIAALNAERKRRAQLPLYDPDHLVKPKPRRSSLDDLVAEVERLRKRQEEMAAELERLRRAG